MMDETGVARKFASRKWMLCIFVILVAIVCKVTGCLDGQGGAELATTLRWVVGLYMAGNVGSAVADKLSITTK